MSSEKLKIFPYMLARVGGLPFSILENFRLNEDTEMELQFLNFQKRLQDLSYSEILLKGALQTSPTFFENILRYQNKVITDFRKKEKQTQRSLFQYLSRTVGKTSPFSTLTTLSPFYLEKNVFKNINSDFPKSNIRYNNQLFLELQAWMIQETDLFRYLKLTLNSTLKKDKNDLVFFNEKNHGTVQRIESNEVIAIIVEQLKTPNSFNDLLFNLLEIIDAEEDELTKYIFQLVDLGLMDFYFPDFLSEENPFDLLESFIISFPKFKHQDGINSILLFLKKKQIEFQDATALLRSKIKKEIIHELKEFGLEDIPLKYLFYEDVGTNFDFQLEEKLLQPILATSDLLAEILTPLIYDSILSKVLYFFEKNQIQNDQINLMNFVEQFPQQESYESEIYKKQIQDIISFWKTELKELVHLDEKGNVNLFSKDLQKIHQKMMKTFSFAKKRNQKYHSGHFQFFKENDSFKAVVNGIASGHGKLFGRFTYFFPQEIIKNLKDWNTSKEDEIWIQNDDDSVFNSNTQECFFNKKINSIALQNLEIRKNKNELTLWKTDENKQVKVFDTGVVNPNERSILFQLLKIFGAPHLSFSILVKIVNELLEKDLAVKNIPRITIDNHLVIQRKGTLLPYEVVKQSLSQYSIPDLVFVKPIYPEPQLTNRLNHKPQLIDFKSPLSLLVFEKILNSKPSAILFSEMLPDENDLLVIENQKYCTEFVLQWKKEK